MSTRDGLYWPFGLDIFEGHLVIAIFVLAALLHVFVGRSLQLTWLKSILVSTVANGLYFVMLFGFCLAFRFGGQATPNPTLFAIEQLTHLSLVTTILMSFVWLKAAAPKPYFKVLLPLAAVQAAWIPLSLLILMSPDRPFQRLERVVKRQRQLQLKNAVTNHKGPLPTFSNASEFAREYGVPGAEMDPSFPRWAVRDHGREAGLQVNTSLSGYRPNGTERYQWIYRYSSKAALSDRAIDLSTGHSMPTWILDGPDDVPLKRLFEADNVNYRPVYKPYPAAKIQWIEAGGPNSSSRGHDSSGNGGVITTYLHGRVGFEDGSVSTTDVMTVTSDLMGRVAIVDLKTEEFKEGSP